MKSRWPVLVVLAATCALGVPATASAALSTSTFDDTVTIFSDSPSEKNAATIQLDDDLGLVFTDQDAGVSPGSCPVVGDKIACDLNDIKHLRVELGGGNDTFAIFDARLIGLPRIRLITGSGNDNIFSFAPVDVSLGPGNDTAELGPVADKADGGGGNDTIIGSAGDDLLKGGSGNDTLDGGTSGNSSGFGKSDGVDTFIGGPGKDKILAKDLTKDKKIDCGSGKDKAKRDSFDPKPKSC
ncbi:hypothetical protein BH10ACT11_BH10ACT11_02630 [soil metagenome]